MLKQYYNMRVMLMAKKALISLITALVVAPFLVFIINPKGNRNYIAALVVSWILVASSTFYWQVVKAQVHSKGKKANRRSQSTLKSFKIIRWVVLAVVIFILVGLMIGMSYE